MTYPEFDISPQRSGDLAAIEPLLDSAFGLGRRTKTAYRLREGSRPIAELCFTARRDGAIVGAIQFWPLLIGGRHRALLLGPLAVAPHLHGQGCGLALMRRGLEAAAEAGHGLVILVGDEPYYARVGFKRVPEGRLLMPGPVDPERLLMRELAAGAFDGVSGLVLGDPN